MATIDFNYGTMGSGKSTYVLQLAYTLEQAGFHPMLAKPSFDTRDEGVIRSRIGLERPCYLITDNVWSVVYQYWLKEQRWPSHLILDEAQFLTKDQVHEVQYIADVSGIQVAAYGLRTAYTGDLFEGTAALMAISDTINELPLTYRDGRKAIMHLRRVDGIPVFDGNRTIVGDVGEDYDSVSRQEWFNARQAQTNK